jgi:hypothetical protein
VQWTLFPDQAIDWRKDVQNPSGSRWPIVLTPQQFEQVTGQERRDSLEYFCNNRVTYQLRGVPVSLEITWEWEAPAGRGDIYEASFRGTQSHIDIRQGAAEHYLPELYIVGADPSAVVRRVKELQSRWPGITLERVKAELHVVIPQKYRVGHEAHFAQVTNRFVDYVNAPESMPAWEDAYMLAKYYVSTKGNGKE